MGQQDTVVNDFYLLGSDGRIMCQDILFGVVGNGHNHLRMLHERGVETEIEVAGYLPCPRAGRILDDLQVVYHHHFLQAGPDVGVRIQVVGNEKNVAA